MINEKRDGNFKSYIEAKGGREKLIEEIAGHEAQKWGEKYRKECTDRARARKDKQLAVAHAHYFCEDEEIISGITGESSKSYNIARHCNDEGYSQ